VVFRTIGIYVITSTFFTFFFQIFTFFAVFRMFSRTMDGISLCSNDCNVRRECPPRNKNAKYSRIGGCATTEGDGKCKKPVWK